MQADPASLQLSLMAIDFLRYTERLCDFTLFFLFSFIGYFIGAFFLGKLGMLAKWRFPWRTGSRCEVIIFTTTTVG